MVTLHSRFARYLKGVVAHRAWLLVLCSFALLAGLTPASYALTLDNPLIEQRADPFVYHHSDGYYYMMGTVPEYDRLEIRRATSIQTLDDATPVTIWKAHSSGVMANHIWAPELHYIDGAWYIYFAAGSSSNSWDIRIYVLQNTAANPLAGEWVEKGEMQGVDDYGFDSKFALDATTFKLFGKRYLIWAQKNPSDSNLYIATMANPWTLNSTPVMISRPEFDWERQRYAVNEGPAVLVRHGRVFVTYSASGTGAEYRMGMLWASQFTNLLNPEAWHKSEQPVFFTADFNNQYGPGHNSFTQAPDGTDIMIYHARNYEHINGDPLHDPNRHMRAKIITWSLFGMPKFGFPPAEGSTGPLQSVLSEKCIAVEHDSLQAGSTMQQTRCKTKDAQMWTLHPDDDGYYQVKAGLNGQCLAVAWSSTVDGGNVVQWPCNDSSTQQWTKAENGDGSFSLINHNSGKCLDLWDFSMDDGAPIKQYRCTGGENQLWRQP